MLDDVGLADEVALLAEGVDRNFGNWADLMIGDQVALLAEGVDRNLRQAL